MIRQIYSRVVREPAFRKMVMSTPVLRDVAWRFVAGEDLDAGITVMRRLNGEGIHGTLNFVGTHVRTVELAARAADSAIEALRAIHREGVSSHLSLKLTQIGLDIDEWVCRSHLRRVLECARAMGNFVRIDMEESAYVDRTLDLFEEARAEFGAATVGIVIQSYLRRRRSDLDRVVEGGSRVRLVKGGYWEPPDVVYRDARKIDRCFRRDIEFLLTRGVAPAIATHDPAAIAYACEVARGAGLAGDAFEFQMLYGVRADLQQRLVSEGYRVRCYVPYGGDWFTYFLGCARRLPGSAFRRLRERRYATLSATPRPDSEE